ncbi:MAG: phospho-N-acetylmuramoyl-pentapeptide-transferase [Bacteroidota bacterium]
MLILLVEWLKGILDEGPGYFRLFDYITFRAGLAAILSLLISMVFGGNIIRRLQKLQIGEVVRDLGLEGQIKKQGTPTMGGIIIILATVVPCLLMAKLNNVYIILLLVTTIWIASIGFLDDYIKVFKKDKKGLSGWFKVMGQVGLGLIIGLTFILSDGIVVRMETSAADELGLEEIAMVGDTIYAKVDGEIVKKGDYKTNLTNVPFLKGNRFDYAQLMPLEKSIAQKWVWIIFIPFAIFVITAISNGANLTDGLDGLAIGVSGIIVIVLGVFAYLSGNFITAEYLGILHLPGTGEMVIFAACLLGACLGFLWYNAFPAQVFMGDTGSLTLGGIIASMGLLLRKEFLLPLLCGIFLLETLSVVIQVTYFKYTKRKYGEGRRVFKMAPIHHHYQKRNMHEVKIVTRFWIVGILLAILTIITLKVR